MFTSMSTVGFGDYHPKSDFERLVCTFILIFGVAIFSMIMGNFVAIIETFRSFNDDLDEGEELARFFGVLRKFNHDEPVPENFRRRLERYFDYRWREDRNQGVSQGQDLLMYMQLTQEAKEELYREFLFSGFLRAFSRSFSFPNWDNPNAYSFYTWND